MADTATVTAQLVRDHRIPDFTVTPAAIENQSADVAVFTNGGTDYYRIPALVAGTTAVLAAIEHRYGDADDHGHLEVEVKRSTDNGATWSSAVVLGEDGTNCVQNPLFIRNAVTGRIHLIYARMDEAATEATVRAGTYAQTIFHRYTDDEGANWSAAVDITSQVKTDVSWKAFYPGPGTGVYHSGSGRVMGPVWIGTTSSSQIDQFVTIYSDDDGDTWEVSELHGLPGSNETTFAVSDSGDIIAISRNQSQHFTNYGMRNVSTDAGLTFTANGPNDNLFGFATESALLALDDGRMVHSRIAATSRVNLSVFLSADDGVTWPNKSRVITGASAYSSMAILPNGKVGILYEKSTNSTISFATFDPPTA